MKLHLDNPDTYNIITGYGTDHVSVRGVRYNQSVIVLPDEVLAGWPHSLENLNTTDFECLLARAPEIVLLGTGPQHRFPSPALYKSLLSAQIGVEIMSTPAACRTYNILAGEGRRVAAALLLD